ncbi:MAG: UDP-glucose 4-epimerase GalE [Leptospirales bacterium]|nr:UDP-glucose 4-epimerase GalE [Leptospirales bacterium]
MRIGVTGGAGYIGSHVVLDLLAAGHQVLVIDNLSTGDARNIFSAEPCYSFLEGDLGREEDLHRFLQSNLEAVFHFAASKAAGDSMRVPELYSANNVRSCFRLIEAMLEHDCRRLVFSSTAAVYGEPQYLPVDEQHPLAPINYYGFTKLVIEQNLQWFSKLKGLRFAALRYFNAAGYDLKNRVRGLEQGPNNLFPILMEVACGMRPQLDIYGRDYATPDGSCIRDYIHVNDLSRAHLMALEFICARDRDLIVNLGSGKGLSVLECLEAARRITGQPIPHCDVGRRPGDPPELIASAALAAQQMNWQTQCSDLDSIVSSMWQVYNP